MMYVDPINVFIWVTVLCNLVYLLWTSSRAALYVPNTNLHKKTLTLAELEKIFEDLDTNAGGIVEFDDNTEDDKKAVGGEGGGPH
jgi:hypothetical protein